MNDASLTTTARWQVHWQRWKHLVAVASFALGVASFLLFERGERVAQALVILLPLSWLLALLEPQLRRWLEYRQRTLPVSPLLLGYVAQALHQESLFFTLPFFFATTAWSSPQLAFTALMSVLALLSIIDPLYYRHVVPRRAALWAFHALAGSITVLTAAPMLWHLTTTEALWLALACLGLISIPAWHAGLPARLPLRGLWAIALAMALAALGWQLRVAIPPATLWVTQMTVTHTVDVAAKSPGQGFAIIDAATLRAQGAYAWSSIHAPRGLRETVRHEWFHEGRRVDVIDLQIHGGREDGYRAWSHKTAFPSDPRGHWQVRVVTQSGQLIGQTGFTVR
ncbi:Protein of unknown function [Fontimonas thermophila]|uniref:DUF2914 domain-containing protein n=1 Tax=Fontimonas thermophila TaxID=1076937 RepID=A0A1I2J5B5_9GAMM|nr:DUF5924 family protein [Fontimonas thermophila]SFF49208.1 Protein of unknown function [Fontimonas thermophila]